MSKTQKNGQQDNKDKLAEAARERELQDLIDRVEKEKAGDIRPASESPNDFVERKMREKFKKES